MLFLRSVLLAALTLSARACAQSDPESNEHSVDLENIFDFHQLLALIPSESIHVALENKLAPKFQDGVFEGDHRALEAVHNNDASLATMLIEIAKHDAVKAQLRKRQNVTESTTDSSSASTVVPIILTDSTTTSVSLTTEASSSADSSASSAASSGASSSIAPTTVGITTTDASGSTIVSSAVVSSTAAIASETSSETGLLAPVVITSTAADGSVIVKTSSVFESSASVSVLVPITTTNAKGQTITTSSSVAAAVITSVNAQGSTVVTTSPLASVVVGKSGSIITSAPAAGASSTTATSPSALDVTTTDALGNTVVLTSATLGEVFTVTDAKGSTFVTTYTPNGGAVNSIVLQTTTLPDGQRSTITSYEIVGGATDAAAQTVVATSTTSKPGLQSGAAFAKKAHAKVAMIGGAVGAALLL